MNAEDAWAAVEELKLSIFPPNDGKGSQWMARTVGGVRDLKPAIGSGDSPIRAVEVAVASVEEEEEDPLA